MSIKQDIISATDIDYSNAEEICGYQLLVCKIFEREGGLDYPPTSNILTTAVKREGIIWLSEVRKSIDELFASPISTERVGLSLGDMPRILGAYDFYHRVSYGSPCYDFLRDIVLKSANRYAKGDKTISETQLALMLLKEMERDIRTMEKRFLSFGLAVMNGWITDLERTGKITKVSKSDAYDILSFLLFYDLFAYGVKSESKLRWINSYLLPDEALDALDTKTYRRYLCFDQAVGIVTGKSHEEREDRYIYLFSRLAEREDIHPFLKQGIAIDLAKFQPA